eukprot:624426-Pleurochrysis_carterae.AAC.1
MNIKCKSLPRDRPMPVIMLSARACAVWLYWRAESTVKLRQRPLGQGLPARSELDLERRVLLLRCLRLLLAQHEARRRLRHHAHALKRQCIAW